MSRCWSAGSWWVLLTGSPHRFSSYLELVSDADEAQFSGLLLHVFAVVGIKQSSDEDVLGLADQGRQGHVQCVVVLLHKLGLKFQTVPTFNEPTSAADDGTNEVPERTVS